MCCLQPSFAPSLPPPPKKKKKKFTHTHTHGGRRKKNLKVVKSGHMTLVSDCQVNH